MKSCVWHLDLSRFYSSSSSSLNLYYFLLCFYFLCNIPEKLSLLALQEFFLYLGQNFSRLHVRASKTLELKGLGHQPWDMLHSYCAPFALWCMIRKWKWIKLLYCSCLKYILVKKKKKEPWKSYFALLLKKSFFLLYHHVCLTAGNCFLFWWQLLIKQSWLFHFNCSSISKPTPASIRPHAYPSKCSRNLHGPEQNRKFYLKSSLHDENCK